MIETLGVEEHVFSVVPFAAATVGPSAAFGN